MNEFSIIGSNHHTFARKGRMDFVITENEGVISQLPRSIGRRIWLALFCENRIGKESGNSDDLLQPLRRRLKLFRSLSNCHGTAWELLTAHRDIRTNGWSLISRAEDSLDAHKHHLLGMYYKPMYLDEAIRKYGYPVFSYKEFFRSIAHTIVVLGKTSDGRFIIFEKEGIGNMPFQAILKTDADLWQYQHCAGYNK